MLPPDQRWKGSMQLVFGLGITVLFFYMMAPFLVAIFLGAVIAILCYPWFTRLKRWLPRYLAGLTVIMGITLGILLPLSFVLVSGAYQLGALVKAIRIPRDGQLESILNHPLLSKAIAALSRLVPMNRDWLRDQAIAILETVVGTISTALGAFLSGLPGFILAGSVVLISAFFFTVDGAKFLRFLASLSPLKRDRSVELFETFEKSCRGVVLGMLLSCIVQGALISLFFLICGLPNVMLMGIIAIVLGMVPVVGTAPITIGAILYLFANKEPGLAAVMIAGSVLVGASDNVVRPWVMKGQSEMHPLLALVSAFGAINLMGATGIFLGPIIAAVFVAFLNMLSWEIRRENQLSPPAAPGMNAETAAPPGA